MGMRKMMERNDMVVFKQWMNNEMSVKEKENKRMRGQQKNIKKKKTKELVKDNRGLVLASRERKSATIVERMCAW